MFCKFQFQFYTIFYFHKKDPSRINVG
jgi:hypothetical protein